MFDFDALSESMNYLPVVTGTNTNDFTGSKASVGKGKSSMEKETDQDHILMPIWNDSSEFDSSSKNDDPPSSSDDAKEDDAGVNNVDDLDD